MSEFHQKWYGEHYTNGQLEKVREAYWDLHKASQDVCRMEINLSQYKSHHELAELDSNMDWITKFKFEISPDDARYMIENSLKARNVEGQLKIAQAKLEELREVWYRVTQEYRSEAWSFTHAANQPPDPEEVAEVEVEDSEAA